MLQDNSYYHFIDDDDNEENNDKNQEENTSQISLSNDYDPKLNDIAALADKILSSNDDDFLISSNIIDDEEDEEDEEEELEDSYLKNIKNLDVLDNSSNESNELSQEQLESNPVVYNNNDEPSEEQILLKKAYEVLNSKNNNSNDIKVNNQNIDEQLFGKYEIIYQNNDKVEDKYTKLVEDAKINDREYKPAKLTLEEIRSKINKYENERAEIQKFLEHNKKEMKVSEARSLIEACLFVLGSDGLNAYDIKKITELPLAVVNSILEEMSEYYEKNINSGITLVQYGNKYKFVTKKKYYEQISLVLNKKERKPLSDSVMETLAIIAYNQPCTKSTIEKIRQKNCFNAIQRLEELGLIEADERSEAIGKPWLYSVTQKFFDLYGIKSLSELPPINRSDKIYKDETDEHAEAISEINEEQ